MEGRVLLIARESEAKSLYEKALQELGMNYDTVSSLTTLLEAESNTPYCGLLLDVPTMVKADAQEKIIMQELLEQFPVARLKVNQVTGDIFTLYNSKTETCEKSFRQFILDECGKFSARKIRIDKRALMVFNVIVSVNPGFEKDLTERTVTTNISPRGCFLFTCREYAKNSEVWMIFKELCDQTPIRGCIRWSISWGESMRMPGLGIEFIDLKPEQRSELESWTKGNRRFFQDESCTADR